MVSATGGCPHLQARRLSLVEDGDAFWKRGPFDRGDWQKCSVMEVPPSVEACHLRGSVMEVPPSVEACHLRGSVMEVPPSVEACHLRGSVMEVPPSVEACHLRGSVMEVPSSVEACHLRGSSAVYYLFEVRTPTVESAAYIKYAECEPKVRLWGKGRGSSRNVQWPIVTWQWVQKFCGVCTRRWIASLLWIGFTWTFAMPTCFLKW